jgi:ribulose-phosphate 3-epimerase
VHSEASVHLQRTLAEIRDLGMQAGVALNPASPLSMLEYVLDDVDMVLIMSVNPGFGGQSFLFPTYAKIKMLREILDTRGLHVKIQVDGGVVPENTAALLRCGADVLVSGSAFFNYPPYAQRREVFEKAAGMAH